MKRWRWACGGCFFLAALLAGAAIMASYVLLGSAWEFGRRVAREFRLGVEAGQWDDDPANWRRAFGVDPPPGWTLVRSRFWRSPHWSREEAYYFHVRVPLSERRLLPPGAPPTEPCPDPPAWMPPPDPARFESKGSALLARDSTDVYLSGCQF